MHFTNIRNLIFFCSLSLTAQNITPDQLAFDITHAVGASFGSTASGASALSTGIVVYVTVPYACTIKAWDMLATPSDTVTIKVWKIATGTALPTSGNSINTSGVGLSSGVAIHSTTLTDFTATTIAKNDIIAFDLTAVTSATYVNFILECKQTS